MKKSLFLIGFLFLMQIGLYAQSELASFSGNGGKNTRPFTVPENWEIQWISKGDVFQIYLYDEEGDLLGVLANQLGPGPGDSFQSRGGTYYLEVNAIDAWTIKIVSLQNSQKAVIGDSSTIASFTGNGGKSTRPFSVPSGWEIRWDAEGDIFQLYLFDKDGNFLDVSANQPGPGNGDSYQAKAGTYYLQVNAIGKWSIEVKDVK